MSLGRKATLVLVLAVSIWHVGSIAAWLSPPGWLRDHVVRVTRRYVRLTKSDQNWAMFAPEPLAYNRHVIARARLASGEEREEDLTAPLNAAIRAWGVRRVGKLVKVHDRILSGEEPVYQRGFALHVCHDLRQRLGAAVAQVTLLREYTALQHDARTFRFTRSNPERATLGTYACPD